MCSVDEIYLSDLHQKNKDKEQSTMADFGVSKDESEDLGTTIAVVRDPTGGIIEASDEFMEELGMPESDLNNMRRLRNELEIEDDIKCHNKAVELSNLEEKYKKHIKENDDAKELVNEIVERVESGEKITLVCFEKEPKWCHRHILKEHIKQKLKQL